MLENEGTQILKFYLHISREEQLIRLKERRNNPHKFWKHNDDDWVQRRKWSAYMNTYETIFRSCSEIPWQIIPADQNWYKEYLVTAAICKTFSSMKMKYPALKTKK